MKSKVHRNEAGALILTFYKNGFKASTEVKVEELVALYTQIKQAIPEVLDEQMHRRKLEGALETIKEIAEYISSKEAETQKSIDALDKEPEA